MFARLTRDAGPRHALRLPADRDTAVRAGRRVRAGDRQRDRRRREGAVPDRAADRGGGVVGAPPGADRGDRPRLRPARDADLAAAREADDDRADVPLRPAPGRPLPPVLAVRRRGDRRRGAGGRRRDRRARLPVLRRGGRPGRRGAGQLDRRPGVPARVHRRADRLLPRPRRRPAADRARSPRAQRAPAARLQGPGDDRDQRGGAADHRSAVRGVRGALREREGAPRRARRARTGSSPGWSAASTTTRGPRSSTTSRVARASSRRSAGAAATTVSCELLGGKPTPGIGFGLGLDRVALVLAEQAGAGGAARTTGRWPSSSARTRRTRWGGSRSRRICGRRTCESGPTSAGGSSAGSSRRPARTARTSR